MKIEYSTPAKAATKYLILFSTTLFLIGASVSALSQEVRVHLVADSTFYEKHKENSINVMERYLTIASGLLDEPDKLDYPFELKKSSAEVFRDSAVDPFNSVNPLVSDVAEDQLKIMFRRLLKTAGGTAGVYTVNVLFVHKELSRSLDSVRTDVTKDEKTIPIGGLAGRASDFGYITTNNANIIITTKKPNKARDRNAPAATYAVEDKGTRPLSEISITLAHEIGHLFNARHVPANLCPAGNRSILCEGTPRVGKFHSSSNAVISKYAYCAFDNFNFVQTCRRDCEIVAAATRTPISASDLQSCYQTCDRFCDR